MSRFRFSLVSFLTVITLLALGLAAMASQAHLATSLAYTAFVVLLCVATAAAVIPSAVNRAFWIGFAVFGWTYWFLEFDVSGARTTPQRAVTLFSGFSGRISTPSPGTQAGLLTADLLDWLEARMTASRSVGSKVVAQWRGGTYYSGTITEVAGGQYLIVWDDGSPQQWTPPSQIMPNSPNLRVSAHATLGGLFALVGGVLVAVLFGPRSDSNKARSTPSP